MKISVLSSTSLFVCFAGQILAADNLTPLVVGARSGPREVRYVSRPFRAGRNSREALDAKAATVATLPIWQGGTGAYTYQMVGANPMNAGSNGTTTIAANVIPIRLSFADGTVLDPSVADTCSTQGSAQSLVLSSPLFNNAAYTAGGVNSGSTQYIDFFQRANFWQYTGPTGINPNYHVLLSAQPAAAVSITVPAANGRTVAAACGRLGEMDINWFDNYLESTVFPQLAVAGVMPSTLPAFILYNTVMYDTTVSNCCILGYHTGFYNPSFGNAVQTYAVGDFETSREFGSTQDTAALSHEIGEWMDNPTGNNATPAWGHTGQVSGCQANLEVGDPLSGTEITVPMPNGFNYHVQELAFKSWFLRDAPSTGVNGWFSSNGTFTAASKPCNSSVTSLTINPTTIATGATTSVSVSVAAASGSTGTPTGLVTLNSGNNQALAGTLTLSNGNASGMVSFPAGSYTVTANYAGDANFSGSASSGVAITVGTPAAAFNPVSLAFGNQNTGSASTAQNVTVTNQGTAPLTVSSVSFTGSNPTDFSQTNNCATVVAGGICTIAVKFAPSLAGARSASLTVADNVTGSPQTVPVSGTGIAAAGPKVSLSASSITFPATAVGGSSGPQTVTITNTGSASLTGISISVGGANASEFASSNTCGSSLAPGSGCTASVTFTPAAAGARGAVLGIADNATGAPQQVSLSGTGASSGAGRLTISSTVIYYGNSPVGTTTGYQSAMISNSSSATVSGISLSMTGANAGDFAGPTSCGGSLAVNGYCFVWLRFTPSGTGVRSANLSIASGGAGSPQTIALTGTGTGGTATVSVSASSLAFPATAVGSASGYQSLTITNTGTAALSGLALSLTGLNASDWGGSTSCGSTLAANASCGVNLYFAPAALGARAGLLSIVSSAANSPSAVPLSGTGLGASISQR